MTITAHWKASRIASAPLTYALMSLSLLSLLPRDRFGVSITIAAHGISTSCPRISAMSLWCSSAIKIPTKRELQDMLAKVPQTWRPLLVTAILTGLRTSELRALTRDHVDLDAKVLHVRQRADAFNKIGQ
jgi:integrase